ncbi:hypothetical protein [Pseudoalteromonas luteoviolacea]|uniref:hypothetical protein n=1 Tax=Pseudoalteromonas luteoviolacea TaxID=43657 RepID=UPI000A94A2F3|nr:hypothetical protein [Pseudoalteromonas luteoviolacea]
MKIDWLRKPVLLESGIPRQGTIARVIISIDIAQFQDSFSSRVKRCCKLTHSEVIALGGKRLKGSFTQADRRDALFIVSAF